MTPADLPSAADHQAVMQLALGGVASRAVHALVHLRVADHLQLGARNAADLARLTQTDERSLLRLLRASAALGLCTEETERCFCLTGAGAALRSDAPRHAASAIAALGSPAMWCALGGFLESMKTGQPVFTAPLFGEMSVKEASRTSETMLAFYGDEPEAVVAAYDFSGVRSVADIGGSSANLLTTILRANRALRGIVFDLPPVAPHAQRTIELHGVADRCQFIAGSFFEAVPVGADAYILSHVINDWPREKCLSILRNIRRAIPANGRLLVIEQLVTTSSDSDQAKFLDLISLAISGGTHRTREEHAQLLGNGGFRLTREIATREPVSILESEPI
jgi:hypothetical protein